MITYCEDCDFVHDRKVPAYQQICMAYPNWDAKGFVSRTELAWLPYRKCKEINNGNCSMFIPKREGENNAS